MGKIRRTIYINKEILKNALHKCIDLQINFSKYVSELIKENILENYKSRYSKTNSKNVFKPF